jgi:hypothetical protein
MIKKFILKLVNFPIFCEKNIIICKLKKIDLTELQVFKKMLTNHSWTILP